MADFKGGKLLAVIGDEVGVSSCAVESAAGQQQVEIAAQLRSISRDIYISLSLRTRAQGSCWAGWERWTPRDNPTS